MRTLVLGVIFLVLAGCAYVPARSDFWQGGAVPVLEPDSASAVVYFLRERGSDYDKLYLVEIQNKEIGILHGDSYFMCKLPAAKYNFWTKTDRNVLVGISTFTIEAGKIYYFFNAAPSFLGRDYGFQPINAEQAKLLLQNYQYYHLFTLDEKTQLDVLAGKIPPQ